MSLVRSRQLRRVSFRSNEFSRGRPMRRTVAAAAVVALLATACGGGNDNNNDNAIPQLNGLTGPTKDATVEFSQVTNMAATPSPDGTQIAFTAQGALWVVPFAGGTAKRITPWAQWFASRKSCR